MYTLLSICVPSSVCLGLRLPDGPLRHLALGGLRERHALWGDLHGGRALRALGLHLPRGHRPALARDRQQDHLLQLAQDEDLHRGGRLPDDARHLHLAAQPPRVPRLQEGPLPVHPRDHLLPGKDRYVYIYIYIFTTRRTSSSSSQISSSSR